MKRAEQSSRWLPWRLHRAVQLAAWTIACLVLAGAGHAQSTDEGRAQSTDTWLESLRNAKGTVVGDLESRFGDAPEEAADDTGATDGQADAPVPASPSEVRPGDPQTAGLIQEWIRIAEPPENATRGAQLHYTNRGNMVGTVDGGVISSPHETGAFDPVFLWTNMRALDSVDHCTMEEYVLAKLQETSISHCIGRYQPQRVDQQQSDWEWASAACEKDYPGSVPEQYDRAANDIVCNCPPPLIWDSDDKNHCISAPVQSDWDWASAACEQDYPGSVPEQYDRAANDIVCNCPPPLIWDSDDKNHCISAPAQSDWEWAAAACQRDHPRSIPQRYDRASGNIVCHCPPHLVWDSNDKSYCTTPAPAQSDREWASAACQRDYPGSVPGQYDRARNDIVCVCPAPLVWDSNARNYCTTAPEQRHSAANFGGTWNCGLGNAILHIVQNGSAISGNWSAEGDTVSISGNATGRQTRFWWQRDGASATYTAELSGNGNTLSGTVDAFVPGWGEASEPFSCTRR